MRGKRRTTMVAVMAIVIGAVVGGALSPLVSGSWLWACVVIGVVLVIVAVDVRSFILERRRAEAAEREALAVSVTRIPAPRDGSADTSQKPPHD
jgi:hypothetical protein